MNKLDNYINQFLTDIIEYSPKIISAFITLFIGLWLTRLIKKFISKILVKRNIEITVANFIMDIIIWALRILLFVTFISKLGIETTSFVAVLGAAGLAIGLSLQNSLSNITGRILIVFFKPFRIGDTIETQNITGTVINIDVFSTQLRTGNNQIVFIPNGPLSNGTIINYSVENKRRADLTVGISYDSNIQQAKEIALQVMKDNSMILDSPEPVVVVKELADSSINLGIRPWSKTSDFGTMSSDLLQQIKIAYDAAGIDIPFPQSEIRIKKSDS